MEGCSHNTRTLWIPIPVVSHVRFTKVRLLVANTDVSVPFPGGWGFCKKAMSSHERWVESQPGMVQNQSGDEHGDQWMHTWKGIATPNTSSAVIHGKFKQKLTSSTPLCILHAGSQGDESLHVQASFTVESGSPCMRVSRWQYCMRNEAPECSIRDTSTDWHTSVIVPGMSHAVPSGLVSWKRWCQGLKSPCANEGGPTQQRKYTWFLTAVNMLTLSYDDKIPPRKNGAT